MPPGADIEVDGNFVGSTPSAVLVSTGSHEITVRKRGNSAWSRKMNINGGTVHLNAELERGSRQLILTHSCPDHRSIERC